MAGVGIYESVGKEMKQIIKISRKDLKEGRYITAGKKIDGKKKDKREIKVLVELLEKMAV